MREHAEGRVADRFGARGVDVGRGLALCHEDAVGGRVVSGPRVPHGRGHMVEVPRVDAWAGDVAPDRAQDLLVPTTRDRTLGVRIDRGVRAHRRRRGLRVGDACVLGRDRRAVGGDRVPEVDDGACVERG